MNRSCIKNRDVTPISGTPLRGYASFLRNHAGQKIFEWLRGLRQELAKSKVEQAGAVFGAFGAITAISDIFAYVSNNFFAFMFAAIALPAIITIIWYIRHRHVQAAISSVNAGSGSITGTTFIVLETLLDAGKALTRAELTRRANNEDLDGILARVMDAGYVEKVYGAYQITPSFRIKVENVIEKGENNECMMT